MLTALLVILILLIFLICGNKGTRSIVSTAMNALILLGSSYLIFRGINTYVVTLTSCILITAVILFYQNEKNIKSIVAFASVIIIVAITVPLIFYIASKSGACGFNPEQYEITDSNGYTRNIGISMFPLQISVMYIALMGTVIDTAVAITSSVYEIRLQNPSISYDVLARSSFNVGKAVLGTSIHTIFYIYIAEYMTLFMQYISDYSFSYVLNSKSLSGELLSISISGIGCCLIVPVTALVSGYVFYWEFRDGVNS